MSPSTDGKGDLLFLAHRLPYPPTKGDKIRSYHLLEYLSRHYRVHLGAFVDDPADWEQVPALNTICGETCLLPLVKWKAKLRSLRGLLSGQALTVPYYHDRTMRQWVRGLVSRRPVAGVLAFSSAMAQYLEDLPNARRVIDFVDVDSDKWLQYAEAKTWPSNWLYAREGRTLLAYDRRMAGMADGALFVSENEANLFGELAPEIAGRIRVVKNGVDLSYFDDQRGVPDPYPAGIDALVFTGAMDYWPNVDAVCWLAREVLPDVLRLHPRLRFYVVGSNPAREVLALGRDPGVVVTGRVADVRPFLAHGRLVLAPLRVARGIQNKVLEAFAMGKPVLASSAAIGGMDWEPGLDLIVADTAEQWVAALRKILEADGLPIRSKANRRFVCEHYDWDRNLSALPPMLRRPNATA